MAAKDVFRVVVAVFIGDAPGQSRGAPLCLCVHLAQVKAEVDCFLLEILLSQFKLGMAASFRQLASASLPIHRL